VDGPAAKVIEIEDFVAVEQIDPVFYDRTYYVGAQAQGEEAYEVLYEALRRAGRVGIGRFVFHNKEQLVALRPLEGLLGLHSMRFHDEVVAGNDLDLPEPQRAPTEREVEMARTLLEALEADFEPEKYEDTYRQAVLELIERKARGEEIEAPEEELPEPPDDLMAALEASIRDSDGRRHGGRARSGGKRQRSRR
jgi:DNA end-binding protein Ku